MHADPFEQLFEESSNPALVVAPLEDRILAANPAGCAMLGYTLEELLETPVSRIHPAEMSQLPEFVQRVLRDGEGSTVTLTCRTKDGTFLPCDVSVMALEGSRGHLLVLLQDRSEHRQRRILG